MYQRHPDYLPPPCLDKHKTVYVDEHLLVVEKPAGLLTVPGRLVKDSLLRRLQEACPGAIICHRLDMDTSGLLIIPIRKAAAREISRQFREREIQKTYVADIWGLLATEEGSIDAPIGPDWENRPRNKIDPEKGKAALTHYRVVERHEELARTRVELKPVTGRSHQLRLHLKHIGHPILGCDLYAHEAAFQATGRLHLHASEIAFTHPESGQLMRFVSQTPFSLDDR